MRQRTIALFGLVMVIAAALFGWLLWAVRPAPVTAPLMVGLTLRPGYEPLFLAERSGFLRGADLRLVAHISPLQVRDAFRNGVVQVAAMSLDEALLLRARDFDLRAILVLDVSSGADAVLARPPRDELGDLAGARVGVEHSALGSYLLVRALERAGLSVDDVTVVPLQAHEQVEAYRAGEVDVMVSSDPERTRLVALGAVPIFDSADVPDEVVDVLVVTERTLREHRAELETLLAGWARALALMRDEPQATLASMARHLRLDTDATAAALARISIPDPSQSLALLSGQPSFVDTTAARLTRIMVAGDLLDPPTATAELAAPELLEAVIERMDEG